MLLVHADVELHNMAGVCAATAGLPEQAEFFWRQAILLAPGDGRAYYSGMRPRSIPAIRWPV
ncbi:MAG TPA: hypothetical protein DCW29_12885 [Janthinobacterium sp.]|nr:hypothetical protein [Janthinobacterium sp.]